MNGNDWMDGMAGVDLLYHNVPFYRSEARKYS